MEDFHDGLCQIIFFRRFLGFIVERTFSDFEDVTHC
ncbi:hypothetical protein JOC58_004816 [Paenibacillus hunanensis]|uniref:Transposase n=1 Tax=Paenibacillus hunanensis TaxID=539262 RepID=A0ABU1J5Q7_9BACL|nr:hypothetical protein [Paenibacillus hunanensis]